MSAYHVRVELRKCVHSTGCHNPPTPGHVKCAPHEAQARSSADRDRRRRGIRTRAEWLAAKAEQEARTPKTIRRGDFERRTFRWKIVDNRDGTVDVMMARSWSSIVCKERCAASAADRVLMGFKKWAAVAGEPLSFIEQRRRQWERFR